MGRLWCASRAARRLQPLWWCAPQEMAAKGKAGDGKAPAMLQLLHSVSGAFRPGVLTALVGVSGAGKTTLMDVLAGRKTGARAGSLPLPAATLPALPCRPCTCCDMP